MNKIYKVVWSKVKNCYVVVSELAKNVITGSVKSAQVGAAPMVKGMAMGVLAAFMMSGSALAAENGYKHNPVNEVYPDTLDFTVLTRPVSVPIKSFTDPLESLGVTMNNLGESVDALDNYVMLGTDFNTLDGNTKVSGTLTVSGLTTLNSGLSATTGSFSGAITASSFNGVSIATNNTGSVFVGGYDLKVINENIGEIAVWGTGVDGAVKTNADAISDLATNTAGIIRTPVKDEQGNETGKYTTKVTDNFRIAPEGSNGSFTFKDLGDGTLFYGMSTVAGAPNPTIVMNAQNGNIETQGSLSVVGGKFVVNAVDDVTTGAKAGDAALAGSLSIGENAKVNGILNVVGAVKSESDVVAYAGGQNISLKDTANALDSAVSTINGKLDAITDALGETATDAGMQALGDRINDVESALDDKADKTAVETAQGDITTLKGQMTTAQNDITTLKNDMTTAQGNISTLQGQMTAAEVKIETLEGKVETAQGKITSLEGQMTTAQSDITTLKNDMTTAQGNISTLQGQMTAAEGKIETLEGKVETAQGDITTLKGQMTEAQGNISTLQGQMTTAQSDISTLQGQMTAAEGKIETLEGKVETAESNAKTYADGVAKTAESNAKTYADGVAKTAESNAKTYADGVAKTAESNAKTYAEGVAKTAEANANKYADGVVSELANGAVAENTKAIETLEGKVETAEGEIDTLQTTVGEHAEAITNNAKAISGFEQRLGKMNGKINKVGAGAAALAALHPLDYDPDDKLTFAAGVGNYAGENAAALGAFYRPDEKLMFSLGGTMGNGENMVNLGVSIGLDGAKGSPKLSKKELVEKVSNMAAENQAIKAENKALEDRIEKLEALVAELAAKK